MFKRNIKKIFIFKINLLKIFNLLIFVYSSLIAQILCNKKYLSKVDGNNNIIF